MKTTRANIDKIKGKPAADALPEGFAEVGSSLAGWFTREAGNTITGILRGSFNVTGRFGERKVYRIEVTAGKTLCGSKDDDGIFVERGGMVGVDETGYLRRLGDLGDGREVYIKCVGKGAAEKDPWIFQIAAKPASNGDDKIPF